jgi:hypothetical protein
MVHRIVWGGIVRTFNLIAEPRVTRLIQFFVYLILLGIGMYLLSYPPQAFEIAVGDPGVFTFGMFLIVGGTAGAVAVLPGVWWLERVGIIALWTGLAIFCVIAVSLGISLVGAGLATALAVTFLIRWLEIRRYQLAPRG